MSGCKPFAHARETPHGATETLPAATFLGGCEGGRDREGVRWEEGRGKREKEGGGKIKNEGRRGEVGRMISSLLRVLHIFSVTSLMASSADTRHSSPEAAGEQTHITLILCHGSLVPRLFCVQKKNMRRTYRRSWGEGVDTIPVNLVQKCSCKAIAE